MSVAPIQFDIGCRDMAQSVRFYQKLGFKTVVLESLYVEITDGCIQIRLKRYSHPAIKLVYFTEDLEDKAEYLSRHKIPFEWRKENEEEIVCIDPNGCKISYSKRMPYMNPFLDNKPFSDTGLFFELSLYTNHMDRTLQFWDQLNYKRLEQHQDFCRISDGTFQIGIYTRPKIDSLSTGLTFCEPDMKLRIPKIATYGITMFPTNLFPNSLRLHGVSKTPEGQYLFLCSN